MLCLLHTAHTYGRIQYNEVCPSLSVDGRGRKETIRGEIDWIEYVLIGSQLFTRSTDNGIYYKHSLLYHRTIYGLERAFNQLTAVQKGKI